MLKKYLLTPLAPVVCLLLLNVWTIVDETTGPARIINGAPDDAPRNAAIILIFISPVLYVAFALLNSIDGCFDRFHSPYNWAASSAMTIGLTMLFFPVFYCPKVDNSQMTGFMMACGTAAFAIWPMCILRRLVFTPRVPVKTIIREPRDHVEKVFPSVRHPMPVPKTEQDGGGNAPEPPSHPSTAPPTTRATP